MKFCFLLFFIQSLISLVDYCSIINSTNDIPQFESYSVKKELVTPSEKSNP